MQYAHISLVPKPERAALRKAGKTLHVCKWCGLKAKRGEPRPLRNEQGYVHQWLELYACDVHPFQKAETR